MAKGARSPRRYVRAEGLVTYWQDERFIVHDAFGGRRFEVPEICCQLLGSFSEPRTIAEVAAGVPAGNAPLIISLLRRLRTLGLIRPLDTGRAATHRWEKWGKAAEFFHFSTRNMAWVDPGERLASERALAALAPAPSGSTSRVLTRSTVTLPTIADKGEYPTVLTRRRTWRDFSEAPVSLTALGQLLRLTFGVQLKADTHLGPQVSLKTSPSAGATHSLEAYVVALNVEGLVPGIYWYDSYASRLCKLKGRAPARDITGWLGGQWWFETAGFVIFLTGVLERIQRRYSYARAYRSWLLEAGHFGQTFCLTATWLDLAPFCTQALADSAIEQRLGLDPASETVLYAMGAGSRPAGHTAAPWPSVHALENPYARSTARRLPGRRVPESHRTPAR